MEEIKIIGFSVRVPIGVDSDSGYRSFSNILAEQYIKKPFTYLLATERALYYLGLGGVYTPYSISHKKKAFTEAVGTIRISLGQGRRAQVPVKQIQSAEAKLLMCTGTYNTVSKVINTIILFE